MRRTLTLTITRDCNLRCRYCYEKHDQRIKEWMPLAVATAAIEDILTQKDGLDLVEIQFFGGEPFLAWERIKEVVAWTLGREWPKRYYFGICTNGTILTEEMKAWLVAHRHVVSLSFSIDGCREAHNLNRSGSYDALMAHVPFFREQWPYQFAKMTINAETLPFVAQGVMALEEQGIPFTANVVFEDIWGDAEEKNRLLEVYRHQLDRLVDFYENRSDLSPVTLLDRPVWAVEKEAASDEGGGARFCGAGHEMVEVDVTGKHSPCHRYTTWVTGQDECLGEVNRQAEWGPDKCRTCPLIALCPTCAGFNWEVNGDSAQRTTFHCEAFKLEVLASARLLARRLQHQSPQDVAALPCDEQALLRMQLRGLKALQRLEL